MAVVESVGNELYSNGERVMTYGSISGKNLLINGGFDIWQRGIDLNPVFYGTYTADRWFAKANNMKVNKVGGHVLQMSNIVNDYCVIAQKIEAISYQNAIYIPDDFTKKIKMTVSLYVRSTSNSKVDIVINAPELGNVDDDWSGTSRTISYRPKEQMNSNFKYITHTFELDQSTDFTGFEINIGTDNAVALNDIEIAKVQIELGDVATQFEQLPIAQTLSMCHRYYWKQSSGFIVGYMYREDTYKRVTLAYPTEMRATPSVSGAITSSGTIDYQGGGVQKLDVVVRDVPDAATPVDITGVQADAEIY